MCEASEIKVNAGNLINIFPEVGAQYKLAFYLWVEEFPGCCSDAWINVIQAVPEEAKYKNSIEIPSISINYHGQYRVCSIISGKEDCYESPKFDKQKWIHFEVTQKADVLDLYLYKVSIDEVTYTISNSEPRVWEKVKLYAGSPTFSRGVINGKIKDLTFVQFD